MPTARGNVGLIPKQTVPKGSVGVFHGTLILHAAWNAVGKPNLGTGTSAPLTVGQLWPRGDLA